MRYILYIFIFLFLSAIITFIGGFYYVYSQVRFEAYKLIDYHPKLTTQIYDRNGKLLANLFKDENRLYVKYDNIPPRVIEALVAIEDTAFFEHHGVNFEAIFRAILKAIKAKRFTEGASTITQQLVKNRLLTRKKKFSRKIKEMVIALKVETMLTKEEILERYLNEVYFGHGYYGIRTASKGYFRKELNELTLKEIAMLVGMPRAPNFYNPTKNYEFSTSRANIVLNRMKQLGWISESEYKKAENERPIVYDDTLTRNIAPYVVSEVLKEAKRKNIPDIETGGYQIHLTVDYQIQQLAKRALIYGYLNLTENLKVPKRKLNGAIVVMKPDTGEVLALVGGINYKKSKFNRATQARRQPGSSFKPFIYQIALNNGFHPLSKIADISRTYTIGNKSWTPRNYERNFRGMITLREALVHSSNLATINLVSTIGADKIYQRIKEFGFKDVKFNLSFALGSFGISPLQLSGQYTIISNYGTKVEPRLINKVINRFGEERKFPIEKRRYFNPAQAYLTIDIMRDVVKRGTGRRAYIPNIEIAGKTGTTNDNIDAWFCGFTPEIQIVVWYGRDDNTPIKRKVTGGKAAAPTFKYFLEKYIEKNPHTKREFIIPAGVYSTIINGRREFFTDISKIPKSAIFNNSFGGENKDDDESNGGSSSEDVDEELLF